jgi:hypothetical protein
MTSWHELTAPMSGAGGDPMQSLLCIYGGSDAWPGAGRRGGSPSRLRPGATLQAMQKHLAVLSVTALVAGFCCILAAIRIHGNKTKLLGLPLSLTPASQSCNCCAFAGCPCCQPAMKSTSESLASKRASGHKAMLASVSPIDDVSTLCRRCAPSELCNRDVFLYPEIRSLCDTDSKQGSEFEGI